jgi:hypothetical protein
VCCHWSAREILVVFGREPITNQFESDVNCFRLAAFINETALEDESHSY